MAGRLQAAARAALRAPRPALRKKFLRPRPGPRVPRPGPVGGPLASLLSPGLEFPDSHQPRPPSHCSCTEQGRCHRLTYLSRRAVVPPERLSSLCLSPQCSGALTAEHWSGLLLVSAIPHPLGPVFWPTVLLLKAHIWPCHFSAETSLLVVVTHNADSSPSTQGTLQLAGTP